MLTVGLAVNIQSSLSSDHITVFAKFLHRSPRFKRSHGSDSTRKQGLGSHKIRHHKSPSWSYGRKSTPKYGGKTQHGE